jgi:hypothetical protein
MWVHCHYDTEPGQTVDVVTVRTMHGDEFSFGMRPGENSFGVLPLYSQITGRHGRGVVTRTANVGAPHPTRAQVRMTQ